VIVFLYSPEIDFHDQNRVIKFECDSCKSVYEYFEEGNCILGKFFLFLFVMLFMLSVFVPILSALFGRDKDSKATGYASSNHSTQSSLSDPSHSKLVEPTIVGSAYGATAAQDLSNDNHFETGATTDFDFITTEFNPSTGLPMLDDLLDVSGTPYGVSNDSNIGISDNSLGSFSFDNDNF
jgi:hypothetical protein